MKNIYSNLSVVLLDDDKMALLQLEQVIAIHHLAKINATYNKPDVFLKELPMLDFDILILDFEMPGFSGKEIIDQVGQERCIVNTGSKQMYEAIIECHPIDILLKPTQDIHLSKAFEKALKFILKQDGALEYQLFNVAESKMKVQMKISDIVYVHSDETDSRNKDIILRNGQKYTLMDLTLIYIPLCLQVSYKAAGSIEIKDC